MSQVENCQKIDPVDLLLTAFAFFIIFSDLYLNQTQLLTIDFCTS